MYHLLHLKVHWYNFQMHNAKIIITINLKKVIQYKTAGGEPFRGGVGAACVKTPHFRVGLRLCGSKRQAVSHFKVEWGLYGPKLPISRWVGAMRVEMPHFATKKGGGGRNRRCESKHTISRGDWG